MDNRNGSFVRLESIWRTQNQNYIRSIAVDEGKKTFLEQCNLSNIYTHLFHTYCDVFYRYQFCNQSSESSTDKHL